jgi:hypothetical protein
MEKQNTETQKLNNEHLHVVGCRFYCFNLTASLPYLKKSFYIGFCKMKYNFDVRFTNK